MRLRDSTLSGGGVSVSFGWLSSNGGGFNWEYCAGNSTKVLYACRLFPSFSQTNKQELGVSCPFLPLLLLAWPQQGVCDGSYSDPNRGKSFFFQSSKWNIGRILGTHPIQNSRVQAKTATENQQLIQCNWEPISIRQVGKKPKIFIGILVKTMNE